MSAVLHVIVVGLLALQPGSTSETWKPAPAPPPTAWARAGATGWRLCDDVGRQAAQARLGAGPREADEFLWRKRVRQCPHEPEVLILAAEEQIVAANGVSWGPDVTTGLEQVVGEQRARLRRALRYVETAIAEARRRGEHPPIEAHYLRAYVLLGLGRYAAARQNLREALAVDDVERYRAQRMGALLALMLGNLDEAVRLAHRAKIDAPSEQTDELASRYIWALVLDRVGAPAAAREELERLRRVSGHTAGRAMVESLLPMHERIYLRALDHQANGERANAVRLWEAYLSRSEPIEADKELARRHQAELDPAPAPVGGPMR